MEINKKNVKSFYEHYKVVVWIIASAITFVFIVLVVPSFIQYLMNRNILEIGTDDGVLGFWGGYIGSIVGVIGAFGALQFQLNKEKERVKAERTDNTFFNLLNMFIAQQNYLVSEKDSDPDIFEEMLKKIKDYSVIGYNKQGLDLFYKEKEAILSVLEKAAHSSEEYVKQKKSLFSNSEWSVIETIQESFHSVPKPTDITNDNFEDVYTELKRKNYIQDFIRNIENEEFSEENPHHSEYNGIIKINENIQYIVKTDAADLMDIESKLFLSKIYSDISKHSKRPPDIDLDVQKKKQIVTFAQKPYRKILGSYFRIFHRIIKYLNENVDDTEIKKNYIGFLRANMNENQMAMIFYNINYTERGSGAIEELKGTSFFGEINELQDMMSAHFFSPDTLVWKKYDLIKMQEFCGN
ncbi:putative phage abortive infection protein [Enterococcus casseliflavus]|uniref:putative phage abortive infection protein n=1 Tax=Enterococcus casseliflavus TaxID=37734 RepID=UPI003D13F349